MSRLDTLPDGFDKLIGRTELVIGEVIGGRYKLIKSLGSGGMGDVFVAENLAIGMRVAVKCLRPELLANPEFRARFQTEAQAVAAIEHPNVARFFDLVVGDPTFIVMEYVRGETLADLLEARPAADRARARHRRAALAGASTPPTPPASSIATSSRPTCCSRPTPSTARRPKLIDFGLAKLAAAAGDSQLTRTGQIIGTPAYMAPEQIRGEPDRRARRRLRARLRALRDAHRAPAVLQRRRRRADPLSPDARGAAAARGSLPDAPPPLEALMHKALHKEPAQRFASVRGDGRGPRRGRRRPRAARRDRGQRAIAPVAWR